MNPSWKQCLSDEILSLPRTSECLEKIDADPEIGFSLPPKNALPGAVLKHVYQYVEKLVCKEWPLIYKVGFTHCAHTRWRNTKYGYVTERYHKWQRMVVIFMGVDSTSAAFTEAALIQKFKGSLANSFLVEIIPTKVCAP